MLIYIYMCVENKRKQILKIFIIYSHVELLLALDIIETRKEAMV